MQTTQRILSALAAPRVLAIDDLRAAVGSPADFGPAVFALEDAGRVVLYRDADPSSIAPARLPLLLREGQCVFTTAALR